MPFSTLATDSNVELDSNSGETSQKHRHKEEEHEKRKRSSKGDDEIRKRQKKGMELQEDKGKQSEIVATKTMSSPSKAGSITKESMTDRLYMSEKERRKEKKESRAAKKLAKDLKRGPDAIHGTEQEQGPATTNTNTAHGVDLAIRDTEVVPTDPKTKSSILPTKRKLFTYSKHSPKRTDPSEQIVTRMIADPTTAMSMVNASVDDHDSQDSESDEAVPINTSTPQRTSDPSRPWAVAAGTDVAAAEGVQPEGIDSPSSNAPPLPEQQTPTSNITAEMSSDAVNDPRLPKIEKAVQKYLVRNDIDGSDFAISLSTQKSFVQSGFYAFGKQYFKKTSDSDFERLTKSVASKFTRSIPVVDADNKKADSESRVSGNRQKIPLASKNTKAKAFELVHQEFAEDGGTYVTGPFTAEEENALTQVIEEYRDQNDMTHTDFCNMVHSLPAPLPRAERMAFWEQFIYLFPNRKSRSVRDHLKRAYIPYERSPFTEEDDEKVTQLRSELGADWKAIAARMGRYKEDIRDRYRNHLASTVVSTGAWTLEENQKFAQILQQYTDKSQMNWAVIAEQVETRTRTQCRDRFIRLQGLRTNAAPTFSLLSPTILGHRQSKEEDQIKALEKKEKKEARMRKSQEKQAEEEKRKIMISEARERREEGKASKREAKESKVKTSHRILPGDTLHMLQLLSSSKVRHLSRDVLESVLADYKDVFTTQQIQDHLAKELGRPQDPSALQARASEVVKQLKDGDQSKLVRTLVDESEDESTATQTGVPAQNSEKSSTNQSTNKTDERTVEEAEQDSSDEEGKDTNVDKGGSVESDEAASDSEDSE